MTPEWWTRVNDLFLAARALPPSAYPAFLDRECPGDPDLRAEVLSLLAAGEEAGDFLETPVALPHIGMRLGAFETLEEVGRGGMGTVYRALRVDDVYRQQVAIKVINRGMDSDSMLHRFRTERQILAGLEHPNIARLLDGGSSPDGRPYYVMEFVEGEPLTRYAEAKGLSLPQRIGLFRQVCAAVEYAHRRLVVHRDLKPGNVLVTADGVPKLLDFGIAKLLDAEWEAGQTQLGIRLMTPGYASPEQVRGEIITTASDVYSLGVMLFELLLGIRPLKLESRDPERIADAICHQAPLVPSAAAGSELRATLSGDLDNIILKALAKDPARRYSSVERFSDDLQRHLEGLPVSARPDTLRYRAGKFVRRHKAGVAAVAALAITFTSALWIAHIEQQQYERAERRSSDVHALANTVLFEVDDAIKDIEGTSAARQLIVTRALQYLDRLSAESAHDAALQREIASIYERISDVQASLQAENAALDNARKALKFREALAAAHPADASFQRELGVSWSRVAQWSGLAGDVQRALAAAQAAVRLSPDDRENQRLLASALIEQGKMLSLHNGAGGPVDISNGLALLEALVASDPGDRHSRYVLARAYAGYADILTSRDRQAEVLPLLHKALAMTTMLLQQDPANSAYRVLNGSLLEAQRRALGSPVGGGA